MEHDEEPHNKQAKDDCCSEVCCCSVIKAVFMIALISALIGLMVYLSKHPYIGGRGFLDPLPPSPPVRPEIELTSMDFRVLNITQTRLSAKWDLSIRIPYYLPDSYICLNGDIQVSLRYKNVIIATSSIQKYNNLRYRSAQLLKVSAVVSEKDISGLIGKDIMEDVKEKKKVRFGSRVLITDCRRNMAENMRFGCHEVTLRTWIRDEGDYVWEPPNMFQFLTKVHFSTTSLFSVFLFLSPIHY